MTNWKNVPPKRDKPSNPTPVFACRVIIAAKKQEGEKKDKLESDMEHFCMMQSRKSQGLMAASLLKHH